MRDLQADLEICNKATPGPWYGLKNAGVFTNTEYEKPVFETGCGCCTQATLKTDDAQFIAAAREGWPEAIERAIKAEEEVVRLRAGLERIKTTIEEYHPHDTLTLPRFSFAKELHDIALAELEVTP